MALAPDVTMFMPVMHRAVSVYDTLIPNPNNNPSAAAAINRDDGQSPSPDANARIPVSQESMRFSSSIIDRRQPAPVDERSRLVDDSSRNVDISTSETNSTFSFRIRGMDSLSASQPTRYDAVDTDSSHDNLEDNNENTNPVIQIPRNHNQREARLRYFNGNSHMASSDIEMGTR